METLGESVRQYGKKALIVTGKRSARETGILDRVEKQLEQAGIESITFEQVMPNPVYTVADAGAELARKEKCDFIIGLGGGSSIDTAKAVAVGVLNEGSVWEYVENRGEKNKYPTAALPVVAVITNAGTGSEINRFAVLTNPATKEKPGITSPHIYPSLSLVDPELMLSVSPRVTAESSLDILFQALEGYINIKANPITDIYAESAIKLVYDNLPQAYRDGTDLTSRTNLALASVLGGMANDQVPCVLLHAMEHPVSGFYKVSHGSGLAALFEPVFTFNIDYCTEKLSRVRRILEPSAPPASQREEAEKCIQSVCRLIREVGQDHSLRDFQVREDDFIPMACQAFTTMGRGIVNNPRPAEIEDLVKIYRQAL